MSKEIVEIDRHSILERMWSLKISQCLTELISINPDSSNEEEVINMLKMIELSSSNVFDYFSFNYNEQLYPSQSFIADIIRDSIPNCIIGKRMEDDDLIALTEYPDKLYDEKYQAAYIEDYSFKVCDKNVEEDEEDEEDIQQIIWDALDSKNIGVFYDDSSPSMELYTHGGYMYNINILDSEVVELLDDEYGSWLSKRYIQAIVDSMDMDGRIVVHKKFDGVLNLLVVTRGAGGWIHAGVIMDRYKATMELIVLYKLIKEYHKKRMDLAS